jgi:hypothetical protein
MPDAGFEVRSYRAVFSLERRIYRIDTLRLNPAGVPLRGIAYAVILAVGALVASALPGISWVAAPLPWYFRIMALPAALGGVLAMLRIDGRPFHVAAIAALRYRCGPRDLRRFRRGTRPMGVWRPPSIAFVADGSEGSMRSLRYYGPGVTLVCCAHDRVEWTRSRPLSRRASVAIYPIQGGVVGTALTAMEIAAGAVLEVSGRPWSDRVHQG